MTEDQPIPWWQKLGALALLIGIVCLIVFGWHRFLADAWPPDRSFVGPNLVASVVQWAIIAVVAVLVWPPWRRRLHRFVDKKLEPVHQHFREAKEQRERHHKEVLAAHAETQRHLKHVIAHHPDIPPLPPKRATKK